MTERTYISPFPRPLEKLGVLEAYQTFLPEGCSYSEENQMGQSVEDGRGQLIRDLEDLVNLKTRSELLTLLMSLEAVNTDYIFQPEYPPELMKPITRLIAFISISSTRAEDYHWLKEWVYRLCVPEPSIDSGDKYFCLVIPEIGGTLIVTSQAVQTVTSFENNRLAGLRQIFSAPVRGDL